MSDSGQALLCDFGLSILIDDLEALSGAPTSAQVGGTLVLLSYVFVVSLTLNVSLSSS